MIFPLTNVECSPSEKVNMNEKPKLTHMQNRSKIALYFVAHLENFKPNNLNHPAHQNKHLL